MLRIPKIIQPTIAIADGLERFPVRRIYCVGQNYSAHAREMGSDPTRNPPFFFAKPADAIVATGATVTFPPKTAQLEHEVELVVALAGGGCDIDPVRAQDLIFGWAVGLDLTRRDLQAEAKRSGRPWAMAKGFDASAPLGPLVRGRPPSEAIIELRVDGMVRQSANIAEMTWSVAEIIANLSSYVALAPGDLIFTGTPSGVGPILRGQTLDGSIVGAPPINIRFD